MELRIVSRMVVMLALLLSEMSFAAPQTFHLSADSGIFNFKNLGPASSAVSLSVDMKLLGFRGSKAWPASAYMGFYEGGDRNNSFQILIIRNRPEDAYLVVGYRLLVGGQESVVKSLENVPLSSVVKTSVSFKNGLVTVRVNGGAAIQIVTPLHSVSPYVSVASGDAEFEVRP